MDTTKRLVRDLIRALIPDSLSGSKGMGFPITARMG
jgi:hypothetical protein